MEIMGLTESFYRGKKVLITGHTGFKGSWLTIWLNLMGADTAGIALDPANENDLFNLAELKGKIRDYRADIRNRAEVERIFYAEKPEIVFHLAAQSLVLRSYNDPVSTFETNFMGTVNLLEACRNSGSVSQVVVVTTDKVYENREEPRGYNEQDPLGGYDPYSASKAGAEIACQSYRRSYFAKNDGAGRKISLSTARAGNVIGGGDRAADRIVPDCIRAFEKGLPIPVRNPDSVRPWQHVLEPLGGYLMLCRRMAEDPYRFAGAWNFGPDSEGAVSVGKLVGTFIRHWGSGVMDISGEQKKFHEAGILMLDISKSVTYLGWKPLLTLDEAVKMTAEWYRSSGSRDPYTLCVEQIEEYTKRWNSGSLT